MNDSKRVILQQLASACYTKFVWEGVPEEYAPGTFVILFRKNFQHAVPYAVSVDDTNEIMRAALLGHTLLGLGFIVGPGEVKLITPDN